VGCGGASRPAKASIARKPTPGWPGRSKIPGPFRVFREAKRRGSHRVVRRRERIILGIRMANSLLVDGFEANIVEADAQRPLVVDFDKTDPDYLADPAR